jgi:hypothetical protein
MVVNVIIESVPEITGVGVFIVPVIEKLATLAVG